MQLRKITIIKGDISNSILKAHLRPLMLHSRVNRTKILPISVLFSNLGSHLARHIVSGQCHK